MQDHQFLTLHWRSFSEWGRERLSTCFLYKGCQYIRKWLRRAIVNILQFTAGYLSATINRETRNAEPEIGTDRSSQTRHNLWVDGYGSGFGLPRGSGSGFGLGLEPNRPIFMVRTWTACGLPGPGANTSQNHCCKKTAPCLLQCCAAVLAALEVSRRAALEVSGAQSFDCHISQIS